LFAPLIEVFELDTSTAHEPIAIPSPPSNAERWSHQHDDTQTQQRKVFDDHLYIADNTSFSGDFVCHGDLYLGKNCRCEGNLKVDGNLYVDYGTTIQGHVFCLGDIHMGNDCQINGMTSVLNQFHSGLNCVVGSEKQPITLAAGEINLSAGSRVYGQIIARKKGLTTYA
jgi:cytoskeletal protein CcmA (bactofilin family)